MKLTYFGHCAFRWETPGGVTVMADPYRNQAGRYWFTRLFPEVHCDLGLISHAHFDHDAADRLPEAASVLRMPGEFTTGDLQIRGVPRLSLRVVPPARFPQRDVPAGSERRQFSCTSATIAPTGRRRWLAPSVTWDVLLVTVGRFHSPVDLRRGGQSGRKAATPCGRPDALCNSRYNLHRMRVAAAGAVAGAPAHSAPPQLAPRLLFPGKPA